MEIIIDGILIQNEGDFYRQFEEKFGISGYVSNPYALRDFLRIDAERPLKIRWINSSFSYSHIPKLQGDVLYILDKLAEEEASLPSKIEYVVE